MNSDRMIKTVKFLILHVLLGNNAYPSGNLDSQIKNDGNKAIEMKNGARKPAFFHPYDAPKVRPRTSRMIAANIRKAPIKSSRLSLLSTLACSPRGLGIQNNDPIATGRIRIATIRKNHLQGDICPPVCQLPILISVDELTIRDVFNESSNDNSGRIGNSPNTRVDRKRLAQLVRFENSHDQSETSWDEGSASDTGDGSNDKERVSVG